jgi:hypothetical protein
MAFDLLANEKSGANGRRRGGRYCGAAVKSQAIPPLSQAVK